MDGWVRANIAFEPSSISVAKRIAIFDLSGKFILRTVKEISPMGSSLRSVLFLVYRDVGEKRMDRRLDPGFRNRMLLLLTPPVN